MVTTRSGDTSTYCSKSSFLPYVNANINFAPSNLHVELVCSAHINFLGAQFLLFYLILLEGGSGGGDYSPGVIMGSKPEVNSFVLVAHNKSRSTVALRRK